MIKIFIVYALRGTGENEFECECAEIAYNYLDAMDKIEKMTMLYCKRPFTYGCSLMSRYIRDIIDNDGTYWSMMAMPAYNYKDQVITGYKAFKKDMTCKGFQYEVGKEYEMDDIPVPCHRGFHFCTNLPDCFDYYSPSTLTTRICKVEASGIVLDVGYKCCTNHIKILEELPEDEFKKAVDKWVNM